jgi:hypothetical protein
MPGQNAVVHRNPQSSDNAASTIRHLLGSGTRIRFPTIVAAYFRLAGTRLDPPLTNGRKKSPGATGYRIGLQLQASHEN